ncbi:MAG: hypothetical protein J0L92_29060 [Deltaproteobacteria bacterium]|nr:hypothetical protein [Deltaproteobacteria bacterium]
MTSDASGSTQALSDYETARSGLIAGVVLGGSAVMLFGVIATVCAADVGVALLAGRAPMLTSALVGVGCALSAGMFGLLTLSSLRMLLLWRRVDARGVVAWATLGACERTGTRINKRLLFRLPLEVTPADGPPFSVTIRWFFPPDVRPHQRPGARVVVRMDPEDRTAVLVDWDATRPHWGLPPASE